MTAPPHPELAVPRPSDPPPAPSRCRWRAMCEQSAGPGNSTPGRATQRRVRQLLRRDPVEEAEHLLNAAVPVQLGHVEALDQRLARDGAQMPGEAGLVVVTVDL